MGQVQNTSDHAFGSRQMLHAGCLLQSRQMMSCSIFEALHDATAPASDCLCLDDILFICFLHRHAVLGLSRDKCFTSADYGQILGAASPQELELGCAFSMAGRPQDHANFSQAVRNGCVNLDTKPVLPPFLLPCPAASWQCCFS